MIQLPDDMWGRQITKEELDQDGDGNNLYTVTENGTKRFTLELSSARSDEDALDIINSMES